MLSTHLSVVEVSTMTSRSRAHLPRTWARRPTPGLDLCHGKLLAHSWTGNVRDVEHEIERASQLATGDEITPDDLVLRPRRHLAGLE